jgi:hypothetical protein
VNSIIFWDMTPYSPLSCTRRGKLATGLLAGLLNYFSTLKMEEICSSETSGATQRTTRRHIPEDDTLHNHRCENLKSYIFCEDINCTEQDPISGFCEQDGASSEFVNELSNKPRSFPFQSLFQRTQSRCRNIRR